MIFLGYDPLRQGTWAWIEEKNTKVFVEDGSRRAAEVFGGLEAVSKSVEPIPAMCGHNNGVEVVIQIENPWQRQVEYSDQAYQDLLEVADRIVEVSNAIHPVE